MLFGLRADIRLEERPNANHGLTTHLHVVFSASAGTKDATVPSAVPLDCSMKTADMWHN